MQEPGLKWGYIKADIRGYNHHHDHYDYYNDYEYWYDDDDQDGKEYEDEQDSKWSNGHSELYKI